MRKKVSVNNYHSSLKKRFLDIFLSCTNIIIFSPVFVICSLLIKLTSKGPVLFIQKRVGKNGKILNLIKFRTMKVGSEKVLNKYRKLNEADGPVFKIFDDPRYTKLGKYLAHTG